MANNTTTLYITRHGQTQWNAERRMQGHANSELTELGTQQATWLHDALQDIDFAAIYASPSTRAYRTAEIIRGQREQAVIACEELKEIGLGSWEGHLTSEIEQQHPAEFFAFWHAPQEYQALNGGETFPQMRERVLPKVDELINLHAGQTILLVTHAVTLKTIVSSFEGRPLARLWDPPVIHPTSLSKIVIKDGIASIELYADVSHHQIKPSSPILEKSARGPSV
ncbi:histidine phosphatase family protein [Dictyobacter formicarum]|uniref:Phosphatase n=1 Tax=Dictyobacter formicarum TaxID=2778368 RepID=A0ABQ3V7Z7_9CHLR|nr:histidine phosphatase family protein [Dictyobacter formicarum]GHO82079.1 phosphatase [Dictyobacter formicarum]